MADATVTFAAKDLNLGSTIEKLKKELGATQSAAQGASKGFDLSFGKIGLAAGVAGAAVKAGMMAVEGATAAARAVVDGFGDAINLGGRLNDLSSRTGETAGNILLLERAFQNAGVGAEKVGGTVNKLQKFMAEAAAGGAEQTATLDALGISMADLAGKTPTEQMQVFAKRIAGVTDPAERARAAMTIFGKSGGELLPLLNNFSGELTEAQRQLGGLPGVMDRSNVAFDSLGDQLGAMKTKAMEFAAGFIEDALPALNIFTKSLSGVDAAGWGQALMKQVMSVADFLIGAFQAPMPAIEAIGQGLLAGVKIAGNNYLNALIDAGRFAKAFFSSDLPGVISGVLGNTLIKVFLDGAKALLDGINSVIKAFETWLGAAISNVADFFTTKFSGVLNAVAQDFQAAMSDPIGFVTGKLDSALAAVMANGGDTFQSSFDKAGGSALDKISAGLGAASEEYGNKIVDGSIRAKDEFDKLVSTLGKSDQDFFGAKETAAIAAEKFNEVKAVGTKLREDFEKSATSADAAKDNTKNAAAEAAAIAGSFNKAAGSTKKIKDDLSASAKRLKDIADAEAKNKIDRGGRLEKKVKDKTEAGNFAGARRASAQLAEKEDKQKLMDSIRGTGPDKDRRVLSDILKDYGMQSQVGDTSTDDANRILDVRAGKTYADKFGRSQTFGEPIKDSLKADTPGLDKMKAKGSLKDDPRFAKNKKPADDKPSQPAVDKPGQPAVDKPGQDGQKPQDKSAAGQQSLDSLVQSILTLVQKIEPRLPVAALV